MSVPSRASRIAGGIWGLLVGDAVGVPYEFSLPGQLPDFDDIDIEPPDDFERAHGEVPPGTWSDDGAHALCLLASLLWNDGLVPDDLMRRLTNWYEHGYLAVDGLVFDVGGQTARALTAFRGGVAALDCGPTEVDANGNGSLMRVLPMALWHRGTDAELVSNAQIQSRVTHGHTRAQVCCALYCLWARRTLGGLPNAWDDAVHTLREIHPVGTPERHEMDVHIRPGDPPGGQGSGYVVDCLHSARLALEQSEYKNVVRAAIALGGDTDTTACVAGGLAGVRWGLGSIPDEWLTRLREPELASPLIERLIAGLDHESK